MLYCFDFDCTLVWGHLHAFMKRQHPDVGTTTQDTKYLDEFLVSLWGEHRGFRDIALTAKLFEVLHAAGDHIAIVTDNQYKHLVEQAIRRITNKIAEDKRPAIHIVAGKRHRGEGKNSKIQSAMAHFGYTEANQAVLVDDDMRNLLRAQQAGFAVRTAPCDSNTHLQLRGVTPIQQIEETSDEVSKILAGKIYLTVGKGVICRSPMLSPELIPLSPTQSNPPRSTKRPK